jgi:hypothetical protein
MPERFVTVSALARMLGPEWSRPLVWYWLHQTGIEVERIPGPWGQGMGMIPESQVSEVLFTLRAARAQRRHDGHGGGEARARRIHQGGVY